MTLPCGTGHPGGKTGDVFLAPAKASPSCDCSYSLETSGFLYQSAQALATYLVQLWRIPEINTYSGEQPFKIGMEMHSRPISFAYELSFLTNDAEQQQTEWTGVLGLGCM